MMRIPTILKPSDVDEKHAWEIAQIGAVASNAGPDEEPVGHRFEIAGHPFTVTAYITREEFLEAVDRSGVPHLHRSHFSGVPARYHFQRVSTD